MADSSAFHQLHPKIQRWLWQKGWKELRDVQEQAITPILGGKKDVLIAAATAGGKTEAAFLPIISRLIDDAEGGIRTIYIGPLKALINDQARRLEEMTDGLDIKVTPWHGDVSQSKKSSLIRRPAGILLITPESLEALFVRRGTRIASLFARLDHILVDELHAFIGSERGWQLQSLMSRLDFVLKRRIPRIGLSATLGDLSIATQCLRPGLGDGVQIIESTTDRRDLRLQLRGYKTTPPRLKKAEILAAEAQGKDIDLEDTISGDHIDISRHLFKVLRGKDNLVFANSRSQTELYADLLHRLCNRLGVPNEFFPHHGNLAKALREDVEHKLKEDARPITAVCTTTLEMGIDIGSVESVAQVGVSSTVSGLLQRHGRSGRRGNPAIFRLYVQEAELHSQSALADQLRAQLVQAIAMVNLLIRSRCEPPDARGLHLSTLLQQILSVIAQYGGIAPANAYRLLCQEGPFRRVSPKNFAALLRAMGDAELLIQSTDGTLLHGPLGERLVNHYDFFAVFVTGDDYQLVHRGRTLGSLPISQPLYPGAFLIFGGRRWKVVEIHSKEKTIELEKAAGGRVPHFDGSAAGQVHDQIRAEMLKVYQSDTPPTFLDATAQALLKEGRRLFRSMALDRCRLFSNTPHILLFPWRGDKAVRTLALQLKYRGFQVEDQGLFLTVRNSQEKEVREALREIHLQAAIPPEELAALVENKCRDKYDEHLDPDLLNLSYGTRWLDVEAAQDSAASLLEANLPAEDAPVTPL